MGNNPPMPSSVGGFSITKADNYPELKYQVDDLNDIVNKLGKKDEIHFDLLPKEESEIPLLLLWKHFVKVHVIKTEKHGEKVKTSTEKLDYRQFYIFYLRFQLLLEGKESEDMPEKEKEKEKEKELKSEEDNECIICMDAFAEIVLPCSHAFCQKCISDWRERNGTCPICRDMISQKIDDCWFLTSGSPTSSGLHVLAEYTRNK